MDEAHKKNIVVAVVNYFNDDEVISYIKVLLSISNRITICVVNNGSHNTAGFLNVCNSFSEVHFIDAGKNTGYFGAAGLALKYITKQFLGNVPELFILSNTDMAIETPHFFETLQSSVKDKSIGMIGPRIISARFNHEQNPYYIQRIGKSKLKRLMFIFSFYPLYYLYQVLSNQKSKFLSTANKPEAEKKQVYAIHGSMMIFNKYLFEMQPDFFDEAPFLFGEEIYAAEVCRKNNLRVIYDPALVVHHNEHSTTGLFKSKRTLRFMKQSINFIYSKFFADE